MIWLLIPAWFRMYILGFFISLYKCRYHVILCICQLHPITVYRSVFDFLFYVWGSFVLVFSVIMYSFYQFLDRILFHYDSYEYHWNLMAIPFITSYHVLTSCSGSAKTRLPECFCPWTLPLNIGLNMLPSDYFMSSLDYLLGCSTRDLKALQMILLVMPWLNHLPPVCWLAF